MRKENTNNEEMIEQEVATEVVELQEPEEVVDDTKMGFVIDCAKLNVRRGPTMDALCVDTVDCGEELMIFETDSTDEFYKVCNSAGIEGFCLKKHIAIQP